MDESLMRAARTGNVGDLYSLIRIDGNALRRFEEAEFVCTPLHIAAEEGCIRFAMEIMNLEPSFARKLNQDGLSPMHLAVKKGHTEMALRFMERDKDLVRVMGKSGKTPLHLICKAGNHDRLLDRFLEACPECVLDVTVKNRTALHIATGNKRLDVLRILIRSLRKKDYYRKVVNQKDEDGNTALHMAANNNHPQMLKLLLDCKADKHATNQADLTALDVAQQHNDKESISMLRGCFIPKVSTFNYKLKKQMGKYVRKASWVFFQDIDHISGDDRNALLVILGLLLSSTYQATLSPPGGLSQDGASSGQSVLKERVFLEFYIMTYVVFTIAFFLTLALLKQFPDGFRTALEVLLAFFAICFNGSIEVIAPSVLTAVIIDIFSGVFFLLMVFMSITYEVSKLSVAIMGCSFLPVGPFPPYGVLSGLFFSLILFDEFWKGTGLILVFNLLHCLNALVDPSHLNSQYTVIITAFWFFFHLCRICIKRFIKCCNTFVN